MRCSQMIVVAMRNALSDTIITEYSNSMLGLIPQMRVAALITNSNMSWAQ
jgi:hypothetical protein